MRCCINDGVVSRLNESRQAQFISRYIVAFPEIDKRRFDADICGLDCVQRLRRMSTIKTPTPALKYHPDAYRFVDQALRFTQRRLGRTADDVQQEVELEEASAHISGPELLDGVRELAIQEFGLLTIPVLKYWGIRSTDDFGRIVFDFIERGAMRKTDRDQLTDFFDVYDFEEAFDKSYQIDLSGTFAE